MGVVGHREYFGFNAENFSCRFRAGVVTSMTDPGAASCPLGLAYIRTQAGGIGLKVSFLKSDEGMLLQ